jgi:hypothetical protein
MLVIDDKYLIDGVLNRSSHVQRLCDLMEGDIGDIWRVRARPGGSVRDAGPNRLLPAYRVMWMIDNALLGEGGYVTTSGHAGQGYTKKNDTYGVAPAINLIAQIGSIVILTEDDIDKYNEDGDGYTYCNIRHDAHFHADVDYDGRIYFTSTTPGTRPTYGLPILGEMVGDQAVANTDTELGKETVNWCPQISVPFPPDTQIVPSIEGAYTFPVFRAVAGSVKRAAAFPHAGASKPGWTSVFQVPNGHGADVHLGIWLEYSAANAGAASTVVFDCEYVVVPPDGSSMSTAAPTARTTTVDIPAGCTEDDLYAHSFPLVSGSELSDGCMVIAKILYRDFDDADDLLGDEVLIEGFKAHWTDEDPGGGGMI